MILGTYANLGAIDEHQSGVDIPIDRLPDIHVAHSTEAIHISPSKMKQLKYNADMAQHEPSDAAHEANAKLKIPNRKIVRTKEPPTPPPPPVQVAAAREISLVDIVEPKNRPKPIINANDATHTNGSLNVESNVHAADKSKSIVASHGSEPTNAPKKNPSDSLINKDAIQKEEREIEFNANEQLLNNAERTQEIFDAVKNELNIQNEANHKLVLQKINEISEKVNRIAQKDEQLDTLKLDLTTKSVAEPNKQGHDLNGDQMKKPLPTVVIVPPVPIAKLLVERKVSSEPVQLNEPKQHVHPTNSIVVDAKRPDSIANQPKVAEAPKELPPHNQETNANIGRDLLSHQTA